jgi:hypothetical protein
LRQVLDTFGADPNRWPSAERVGLEALVKADQPAKRLLVEAQALARVMDAAPTGRASSALSARIVAAAIDDPVREAVVVPLSPAHGTDRQTFSIKRAALMWPAAALAASFAFGLYMGIAGIGAAAVESVFYVAMTDSSGNDEDGISWLEDSAGADEEGLL